jgi:N-acetylneuraminic acid mutarotase
MKKSTSQSAPARRSLSISRNVVRRPVGEGGFSNPRTLIALLLCAAAACSILAVPLLAFLHPGALAKASQRTLTFAERVAYQRAIEDVYWRHRIWPKERPDPKPSLDGVMSQAQLEKKVADYLRKSQALEDHWQRPITAEQLQAEMDRMAKHTRQPEVLRELFDALGNDPFVIAECLARPALAERLVTNWYAYDQRIHGELRQRAEADLRANNTVEQMKQTSGGYSEIEFVKSDSAQDKANRGAERSLKLNSREWDETVQKLATMFGGANNGRTRAGVLSRAVAAGVSPAKGASITQIKTGVLSSLQEDEGRYYATAVIEKAKDHLKLAIVAWLKEPFESWRAKWENEVPKAIVAANASYTLPTILEGAGGCVDDTWTATAGPPDGREHHTAVWTGSEMIVWGGEVYTQISFGTGGRYSPITDTWMAISASNAPAARAYHTAVWTGSEMIVWGGTDESFNTLNTGGRYNPGTNSWTATTTINAPAGRWSHAAVWTGSQMIVWGGWGGSDGLNSGGKYNPNTDSWTATSTTNAPDPRTNHTAVWAGSEMIVWGGWDGHSTTFNTGGRYNPGANSWTATSTTNAPDPRTSHTAVWTGSEMIVWGGLSFGYWNTGGRYNPSTNSWTATSTANAPSARSDHTAIWSGNEMIVWGGSNLASDGGKYNPATNSWLATSQTNAPDGRQDLTAVWTGSEMIVWGGYNGSDLNTGGRYDPSADSWVPTGNNNAPAARFDHTAVWTGSEMIVWGGDDQNFSLSPVNTGGTYSPGTDSWMATGTTNAPDARTLHTAVWSGSEMIVWGGKDQNSFSLNTGGRYNPGTNGWTATSTANAPDGRYSHTAVWTGSEMIVWGGYDGGLPFNTGGRYNPSTNSWTATSTTNAPDGRYSHTALWTGSEMIVWGGYDGSSNLHTGGRYDPGMNSWTATSTTNVPTGRSNHTAVWTGSEMIVWGGLDESFNYTDTGGRYDPGTDTWTPLSTTNAPAARALHTAVWTESEMIVWGGADVAVEWNTGGRYSPGTDSWTATSTANAPSGRDSHIAVWTGNEMIVWGGQLAATTYTNTGGRYCAQSGPTPTPTPTPTATPTPTPTPTVTPTPTPTPGAITLSAHGRRVQGRHTVDLSWNGATSANIDIYRNGVVIATVANTGAYKDFIGVRGGNARYIYMVCDAGTQNCSNQVTVRFGGPPL